MLPHMLLPQTLRTTLFLSPCLLGGLCFGLQMRHVVSCTLLESHRKRIFEEIGFVRELLTIPGLIVNTQG